MIYLMTGGNGAGKTLSAVEIIRRTQREQPNRLIYAANINGLNIPGVIILDDPGVLAWHEACEKDSLILVDEAQRYWRAQRSGEPSKAIIEMETHRHDGIDIILMTQHPTFLHSNIRKLVHNHVHLVSYTKTSSLRWDWRECHDDVQDNGLRATGEFKEWHYPTQYYGDYISATQHTKRAKRPLKQILGRVGVGFGALVMIGVFVFVGYLIHNYRKTKAQADNTAIAASPNRELSKGLEHNPTVKYTTTKQYVLAQIPRVANQPWSAPLYDGAAVTTHPRIFCMSMEPPGKCLCNTEQGTHYLINDAMCRDLAKNGGPYDPYLPQDRNPQSDRETHTEIATSQQRQVPAAQAPIVPVSNTGGHSDYAGVGPQTYTPPTYGNFNPDYVAPRGK